MNGRIQTDIFTDAGDCARHAARLLSGIVDGGANCIGLATGATFAPVYAALEDRAPDLSGTHLYLLDEYLGLDPDDPRSFRNTITRQVCEPLRIPTDRLHGPLDHPGTLDEAAGCYESALAGIDVQLLGIGTNGHIGFNEPGAAFSSVTRVVELSPQTRADNAAHFAEPSDVPTHAITQGIATILRARRLVLVATGRHKANALARALLGAADPATPASAVQLHPDVHVLADRAAACLLIRRRPVRLTTTTGG